MKRLSAAATSPCPVARALDIVGDRWVLLIVRDAFDGARRFTDFQKGSGLAKNILSDRLRRLVEAGLMAMEPVGDSGARHGYVLTESGKRLFPVVVALRQWAEHHLFEPGEAHSVLIERSTGAPVEFMWPRSPGGGSLNCDETYVQKVADRS